MNSIGRTPLATASAVATIFRICANAGRWGRGVRRLQVSRSHNIGYGVQGEVIERWRGGAVARLVEHEALARDAQREEARGEGVGGVEPPRGLHLERPDPAARAAGDGGGQARGRRPGAPAPHTPEAAGGGRGDETTDPRRPRAPAPVDVADEVVRVDRHVPVGAARAPHARLPGARGGWVVGQRQSGLRWEASRAVGRGWLSGEARLGRARRRALPRARRGATGPGAPRAARPCGAQPRPPPPPPRRPPAPGLQSRPSRCRCRRSPAARGAPC